MAGPPLGRRSRQVSGSKCAAVHAGRTVTRTALARRWHVNDVQTAIPAPRQLRILGHCDRHQLANWSCWASCTESGSFAVGCVQRHTSRGRTALLCAQTKWPRLAHLGFLYPMSHCYNKCSNRRDVVVMYVSNPRGDTGIGKPRRRPLPITHTRAARAIPLTDRSTPPTTQPGQP